MNLNRIKSKILENSNGLIDICSCIIVILIQDYLINPYQLYYNKNYLLYSNN